MELWVWFFLLCFFFWLFRRSRSQHLAIPGPRHLPFLGNLLSMPLKDQPLVFHEWSKSHGEFTHILWPHNSFFVGDVIGFRGLGNSVVVLNSEQAARDLFDKRSATYSDRPRFPMLELYVSVSLHRLT